LSAQQHSAATVSQQSGQLGFLEANLLAFLVLLLGNRYRLAQQSPPLTTLAPMRQQGNEPLRDARFKNLKIDPHNRVNAQLQTSPNVLHCTVETITISHRESIKPHGYSGFN
jgi:hypothetical protein